MTALQHYLKEVEKKGQEKGVETEKKTVRGIINKIESMPGGEVPQTTCCHVARGIIDEVHHRKCQIANYNLQSNEKFVIPCSSISVIIFHDAGRSMKLPDSFR